jgi:aspartate/methionine/tyrosine aminotransferase
MKIVPFKVELWMNEHEDKAIYNTGETCVDSISMDELFAIAGLNKQEVLNELTQKRLTYGHIFGNPKFKEGIASLYETIQAEDITTTHGAIGANHLVLYSLVEPEDEVVAVLPTYQQLYSIPASFQATVKQHVLTPENNFLPDLTQLRNQVSSKTKMIIINNPNNPSGALMDRGMLEEIIEIARAADAYILSDETYRGLTQEEVESTSIAVSSMSKVWSLAGLRLGWIATKNVEALEQCLLHRDHNTISCGMIDEELAAIALANKEKILARNLKIVRDNLKILDEWVAKEPHISYVKPQAGTVTLLYYDFDLPSRELCLDLIDNHGLLFTPGDCFEFENCVRIGYGCSTEELIAGLNKFSEYLATI